jgi:hypothetical protein
MRELTKSDMKYFFTEFLSYCKLTYSEKWQVICSLLAFHIQANCNANPWQEFDCETSRKRQRCCRFQAVHHLEVTDADSEQTVIYIIIKLKIPPCMTKTNIAHAFKLLFPFFFVFLSFFALSFLYISLRQQNS